ncbi:hypothetical protein [Nocardiopsis xinjiangensis]|uniref:hypothetical protein n=1 Tax=Nocardiopsis xinjiangensis TaxID=124285 RepID=UPI00034B3F67|nr:hypothetical protein [Nocardiopsis xinjiangensis]
MGRTRHPGEPGEPDPDRAPGKAGDRSEDQEGEGGNSKKIDLSLAQVAGAGGATLTAAAAASYLDVYGTVIGTAVMAILSTTASPLLSHWFSRSGEQAKHLAGRAVVSKGRTLGTGGTASAGGTVTITGLEQTASGTRPTAPGDETDATRTRALPVLGADTTQADREATRADGAGDTIAPDETVLMPAQTQAGQGPHPHAPALGPGGGDEDEPEASDEAAPTPSRRGWRAVLFPAVLVFIVVMLVILAFELFTGRSLTSWTRGAEEPTSPSIMGGNSAPDQEEEPEPELEAPAIEEPPAEEPGFPQQQPTQEPEPEQPEEPEGGNGTDGDGSGGQPTPAPGGQEDTPPTEEQPEEDLDGSDPPPPEPGEDGQDGQVPEQQSD